MAASSPAGAQGFPERAVRIVAGQQAGSATDAVARLIADALETQWGVAVTVENKPGAGGTIGAEAALLGGADGYTLFLGGTSNLVIAPATDATLRYDPMRDFMPIARIASVPFAYAVNADVPARSLKDLAALARARPGAITYATLGPATTTGVGMRLFLAEAGVDMLGIEYKGSTSAYPDVLAGRVDVMFNEIGALAQHAQNGRIRVLAIASPRRALRLPDIPTTAEQGFSRLVVASWYGLLAPAGTPPDVHKRIADAVATAMRNPVVRKRIEALGYEPIDDTPALFRAALRDDIATFRALAR
ncbi:MAG: Bug family tripartite tricarboxylate transporter substrate binding protein [Vicinamibacteria bacterium]|jgi:tripartite-type tricarboxylate transporter receptor subunit TctC